MSLLTLLVLCRIFLRAKNFTRFVGTPKKYFWAQRKKCHAKKKFWHAEKEFVAVKFFTMILGMAKIFS